MSSLLLILHDAQDCTPAGRERLKQELAKGFDLSESALNDIFADLPSILRRAEDRAEADSLKQIIEKIGGIVEIIEDTGLTLETIAELDIESSEQMVVATASLPSEPDESVFETSDDLLAELEAQLAVQEETPLRDVPVNEISELAFELEFEAVQPAVTTTSSDDETPNDRGKTRADPDNEPLFNFDVGVAEDSLDEMLQSDPLAQLHYDDELFDTNSQETQTESAVTEEAAPLLDLTLSSDPEYDVPEEEDEQEI
ncbi:MAG: hypothetical protein KDD44_08555, partial [Bdellovibrionales bacterium]|nr:hypothetical protein [Bdellovibrionales bacterium]